MQKNITKSYNKTNWIAKKTVISADLLNKMEDKLLDLDLNLATKVELNDTQIKRNATWSSNKIAEHAVEQDGVFWAEREGNFISADNTYEYKLKEIEIFGDTIQGFKDEITHQQIVDSIKATGLDNNCRLNDDGTFTVSHAGFSGTALENCNKEGFIQLKPNTEYSTYCWRDNGSYPNVFYTLYDDITTTKIGRFTTGESGKVLIYPMSAQEGKLKLRVVEGKHDLSKYPYEYNLSSIEHVGELYVDEKGKPKLDEHGNKQYKLEVSSNSFLNLYNPLNAKGNINATLVNATKFNVVDGIFVFLPENHFQTIEVDVTHFKDKYGNSLLKLNEVHKIKFEVLENSTSNTGMQLSTSGIFKGYTKTLSRGETGVFEFSKQITNIPNESVHGSGQVFVIQTHGATDGVLKVKVTFSIGDGSKPKSYKETIILPCQLSRVGDIKDRLYWDESKGNYIVEKNITELNPSNINPHMNQVVSDTHVCRYAGASQIPNIDIRRGYVSINNKFDLKNNSSVNSISNAKVSGIAFGNAVMYVCVEKSKLDTPDYNGLSKWWVDNKDSITIYACLKTPQLIETNITEPITLPTYNNKTYLYINNTNNAKGTIKAKFPLKTASAVANLNIENTKNSKDISDIKELNVNMVATNFDMDYRLLELEWALEDAGITNINLLNTLNIDIKNNNKTLTRYEQAKIIIIKHAYEYELLAKQLSRYLEKDIITQDEYDELIALMEENE